MKSLSDTLLTCGKLLIEHDLTIAFAESATAGRMAAQFSLIPQAGKFLKGGLVCYDANLKTDLLHVSKKLIEECTPESKEVTAAITKGLQDLIPADISIGCTGLTCPGGSETDEKPVGTMFICGMQGSKKLFAERNFYNGDPEDIVIQTVERIAELLIAIVNDEKK